MDGSGVARLIALAHNEIEARHDYEAGREAHAKPRAPEPDDTDSISRYLARLVYEPKRKYATDTENAAKWGIDNQMPEDDPIDYQPDN